MCMTLCQLPEAGEPLDGLPGFGWVARQDELLDAAICLTRPLSRAGIASRSCRCPRTPDDGQFLMPLDRHLHRCRATAGGEGVPVGKRETSPAAPITVAATTGQSPEMVRRLCDTPARWVLPPYEPDSPIANQFG